MTTKREVLLALVDDFVIAILVAIALFFLAYEGIISPVVALAMGVVALLLVGVVAYKSTVALLMKPKMYGGPVGKKGTALTELEPAGIVLIDGERWQAVSRVPMKKGSPVVVLAAEGLRLTVEPADRAEARA
jgi:membrane protein implicated in regulation of membrane protease activity